MSTRLNEDLRNQLRRAMAEGHRSPTSVTPQPATPPRVKMSFWERLRRMLHRSLVGLGIVLLLGICLGSRLVAAQLATGKKANAVSAGLASLGMIGVSAFLLRHKSLH